MTIHRWAASRRCSSFCWRTFPEQPQPPSSLSDPCRCNAEDRSRFLPWPLSAAFCWPQRWCCWGGIPCWLFRARSRSIWLVWSRLSCRWVWITRNWVVFVKIICSVFCRVKRSQMRGCCSWWSRGRIWTFCSLVLSGNIIGFVITIVCFSVALNFLFMSFCRGPGSIAWAGDIPCLE